MTVAIAFLEEGKNKEKGKYIEKKPKCLDWADKTIFIHKLGYQYCKDSARNNVKVT